MIFLLSSALSILHNSYVYYRFSCVLNWIH